MTGKEPRPSVGYQIVDLMRRNPDRIYSAKELAKRIKGQTVMNISNICRSLIRKGYVQKVPLTWGNKGKVGFKVVMERGPYPKMSNYGKLMKK